MKKAAILAANVIVPKHGVALPTDVQAEVDRLCKLPPKQLADKARNHQNRLGSVKKRVASVRGTELADARALGLCCLAAKKQVGHDNFLAWLRSNKLSRSIKTLERYMVVAANSSRVTNLNLKNLNQAYIALGLKTVPGQVDPAK